MMRNERCPLCGAETDSVLQLRFNAKMKLPAEPEIRHCASDNFLFVASGCQADYDEYYESLANDTYHTELSEGGLRSPIAELQLGHLSNALGGYLDQARGKSSISDVVRPAYLLNSRLSSRHLLLSGLTRDRPRKWEWKRQ